MRFQEESLSQIQNRPFSLSARYTQTQHLGLGEKLATPAKATFQLWLLCFGLVGAWVGESVMLVGEAVAAWVGPLNGRLGS